jgi:hypothetical protein
MEPSPALAGFFFFAIDLVCGSAMGEQGEGHPWPRLQVFPFTHMCGMER